MMQYIHSIKTLRSLIIRTVPAEEGAEDVCASAFLYLQDCTNFIDYYIFSYSRFYDEVMALIDPLSDSATLELGHVPIASLEYCTVYYHVYRQSQRPSLTEIKAMLMPLKYRIPQTKH